MSQMLSSDLNRVRKALRFVVVYLISSVFKFLVEHCLMGSRTSCLQCKDLTDLGYRLSSRVTGMTIILPKASNLKLISNACNVF